MNTKDSTFTEKDMNQYRAMVSDISQERKDNLIGSPSPHHAAIVFKNLIQQTTKEIHIYDKDLSGDILSLESGTLELLKSKIENDIKVVFVVDNKNLVLAEISPLLNYKNVEFLKADEEFKKNVKKALGNDYYFAVADDSMFRLEFKDGSRNAICSFNNKNHSHNLLEVFNSLHEVAD